MKKNKKITLSLLLSIIGLLFLVVGSSFALFQNSETSTKNQIISTGATKIKLTEAKEGLTINNLKSLSDIQGLGQTTYYDFTISNIGDTDAELEVLLVEEEQLENALDISVIKVG